MGGWEDPRSVAARSAGGAGGSVSTDALWDAAGDLAVGTGADTADRLAVGSDTQVLTVDTSLPKKVKWATPASGTTLANDPLWNAAGDLAVATAADTGDRLPIGVTGQVLTVDTSLAKKVTWGSQYPVLHYLVKVGETNFTTSSSSKTPIDATKLAFQYVTLAVGDLVRCTLNGCYKNSSSGQGIGIDFEVDQPTSANVYIGNSNDYGVAEAEAPGAGTRFGLCAVGLFVATEAGSHGFRPVWLTSGGTASLVNGSTGQDDVQVVYMMEVFPAAQVI